MHGIMSGGSGAPEEKLAFLREWGRARLGAEPGAGAEVVSEEGSADVSDDMSSGSEGPERGPMAIARDD